MIIVGAGGFAKEVLEIFHQKDDLEGIAFFDNLNAIEYLYEKFSVLKTDEQVKKHFEFFGPEFTIGVGKPISRKKLYEKFINLGGVYISSISLSAIIGSYDVNIGNGTNILAGAILSNSTTIGIGGIIYYNTIITHDCVVGDFVELSPNVQLLGNCKIGDFTQIGAGSIVLPNIIIGNNVVIGAGSIITKNVPSNCLVYGTPARIVKENIS